MASGMLGTAITGLQAFQRSLETTSHNISNVNTEGYSRQRVDLATNKEQMINVGYLGTGVSVNNITRSYDQFITTQLRSSTAAFGDVNKYSSLASQVDDILADPSVGMAPAIKSFFNAVNDSANDPTSIPARQVLLSKAEILTSRFDTMNSRFGQIRKQINSDMVVKTGKISSLAAVIADLNGKIANAQNQVSANQQPNDLLDKRDSALNKLAELVDISVVPSNSNMVSVFMGQGQELVLDTVANKVITKPSEFDPSKLDVAIKTDSGAIGLVTKQITGGALAGTLRFREQVLDPAQQQLGSVAASIAMEFNTVHGAGFDLDGVAGGAFFKGLEHIDSAQHSNNTGGMSLTATFDANNIKNIDYSDYLVEMTGKSPKNTYKLTRLADNQSFDLVESAAPNPLGFLVPKVSTNKLPGINIAFDVSHGVANIGDSFFIRPTYSAASKIGVGLTDPRKIALATNIATDSNNVDYVVNGPMPGDNRNGVLLAGLENKQGMLGGTASFQDGYGLVVSDVGVLTSAAKTATAAQETLLNNAKDSWGNVSGVNLDEEAANLIKFQQSYQAAAKVVSVSKTLFDSLIGAIK